MSFRPARAWCWGAGVDSSWGIADDILNGRPIDMITFAHHGSERRTPNPDLGEEIGTYDWIELFSEWIVDHGYPAPVICKARSKPETAARYREAAIRVVETLKLKTIDDAAIDRLSGIFGNMAANETLPSIAFGGKSCSIRWKVEAQEFY